MSLEKIEIEWMEQFTSETLVDFHNNLKDKQMDMTRITSFQGAPQMDRERLFSKFANYRAFFATVPFEDRVSALLEVSRLLQSLV